MGFVSMRRNFGKHMRTLLIIIAGVFLVSCFVYYGAYTTGPARRERASQSGPVATVNGQDIDRESFDLRFTEQYDRYQQMGLGSFGMLEVLRREILDSMIQQKLLVAAAEQQGISVSNRDVNKEIERQVDEILKARGQRASQNSEDRRFVENAMRRRSNEVRDQMLMQRLADMMKSQVKVTDEAVRDSYKQVKARHILIQVKPGADKNAADSAARKKADEVLAKLKGGADFATMARQVSDDKETAPKGGDLGWLGSGQTMPEFERAAFGLKPGEMSGVVKSPSGYHIIRVEEVRYNLPKDFEQKKAEYRKQYVEQQAGRAWQEFTRQLQSQAKIEIRDPEMRAAKAQMEGRNDEAIAEYTKALESADRLGDQAHAAVLYNLGRLYAEKKDWKKAVEMYEHAIDVAPSSLQDVYVSLGDAYAKLGKTAKALEYYKNAEDEAPDDMNVRYQLLTAYKNLGDTEAAARQQKFIDEQQRKFAEEQKKRTAEMARQSAAEAQKKAGTAETKKAGAAKRPQTETPAPAKTESTPAGGR
jgi:parvulin-like peptidyl-prolyl isomerase